MTVHELAAAARMSDAAFRLERVKIRATYGDTSTDRTGAFEQALAALYARSGWTQDQLAAEEDKSRQWIEQRLRFGRFLTIATTVAIPKNLTERRFRDYWARTSGSNERQRFAAVAQLMHEELSLSRSHRQKRPIGEAIKATSAGGDWHRLTTITTKVQSVEKGATEADVEAVLNGMVQHGWYNVFCEKKKGGAIYRIVVGGNKRIDLATLKHELAPIIEGLEAEGRKNMATMSPGTVAHLTHRLKKILDTLSQHAPPVGADSEE